MIAMGAQFAGTRRQEYHQDEARKVSQIREKVVPSVFFRPLFLTLLATVVPICTLSRLFDANHTRDNAIPLECQ